MVGGGGIPMTNRGEVKEYYIFSLSRSGNVIRRRQIKYLFTNSSLVAPGDDLCPKSMCVVRLGFCCNLVSVLFSCHLHSRTCNS